jgi:uncharacterized protein (TIGR03067 family)
MRMMALALAFAVAAVGFADEAANKKALKDLEGTYDVLRMEKAGDRAEEAFVKAMSVVVKDGTFKVIFKRNDKNEEKSASLNVDSAAKSIDMTPIEGDNAGKPLLGMFEFGKDQVTICLAETVMDRRPTELKSTKENKNLLIVLKKK